MALTAFVNCARKRQRPLNEVDSELCSTLVPIMATRAIYERRIVTWGQAST